MHYYTGLKQANCAIDRTISDFVTNAKTSNGGFISLSALIIAVTAKHEVSPLMVKKRVMLHTNANENLRLDGDKLVYQ